ncbi:MAG: SDR family oxidoreductase [Xanthomonadales bacterium]|nr:SDR family oxidoreductase [Gammaproteobacteria bacterium]MBT8050796.1 SDR family oxidoreductase [Gammaproteobacteria bacterium]MBT8056316.1 SDR family oxidoreductase [Gammaproteobacteria bacterium]NNJ79927.1 SDR family oxidoreductase [Xanthomonadales bacterium]NNL05773.1 SDR family oxidoreductase [Xanthomonadales bacterium]
MKTEHSIVAITGAGGGLGAGMARRLAPLGARLALLDTQADALEQLRSELGLADGHCRVMTCDVSDEAQVDQTFADVRKAFGGLDVLVNNAGITRDALMLKFRDGERVSRMSLEDWNAVINVNLTGVFLCGRAAAEQMIRSGKGGLIVNVSSISRSGNIGQSNYSAAKAGVAAMTVSWAKELARHGIRVNTISPGFIGTEMVRSMKPEALAKLSAMIPAGRIGEPDEIAQAVQFLIENDFMNGRNLEVDGGMRL